MTPTAEYIEVLARLKPGDRGLLRAHARQGLDESVGGFDLFAGLWWSLRAKYENAPRREVAWLIAKLHAYCPIPHSPHDFFARQMRRCQPIEKQASERYRKRFDRMLLLPLRQIEPALQWALDRISASSPKLDWVKLTDDLSIWERETTRLGWAKQFLGTNERT